MNKDINLQKDEGFQPDSDLQLENEILEMKLAAEFGGFAEGNSSMIPPDLLNSFLKGVYDFEKYYSLHQRMPTVHDRLGCPDIPDHELMTGQELKTYIDDILLSSIRNGILLQFDLPVENIARFLFIRDYYFNMVVYPSGSGRVDVRVHYSRMLNEDKHELHDLCAKFFNGLILRDFHNTEEIFQSCNEEPEKNSAISILQGILDGIEFINLLRPEPDSMFIYDNSAEAIFEVDMMIYTRSGSVEHVKGEAALEFRKDKVWYVEDFYLPGLMA